jgi:hypothetical protein
MALSQIASKVKSNSRVYSRSAKTRLTGFHALFKPPLRKLEGMSERPFCHILTAQPPHAMNRSGFCRGTAMGSFVFLKACPFGNIFGPAAPKSSKKPSQNDGSALIRIMLMDALVGGRLNFSRHWLSLAVGWQQD